MTKGKGVCPFLFICLCFKFDCALKFQFIKSQIPLKVKSKLNLLKNDNINDKLICCKFYKSKTLYILYFMRLYE